MSGFLTSARYVRGLRLRELAAGKMSAYYRHRAKSVDPGPCTAGKARHKALAMAANRHGTRIM